MLHRHPLLSLLTGLYCVFVAWLTLTPQPIDGREQQLIHRVLQELHERGYVQWMGYNELEFLANIGLFVPIGAFLLLLLGTWLWWLALGLSFSLTGLIEYAQRFIPGRVPDERDLIANSLGAVIGVLITLVLTLPATLRRRRLKRERTAYAAR